MGTALLYSPMSAHLFILLISLFISPCYGFIMLNSVDESITYPDKLEQASLNANAIRSGSLRLHSLKRFNHHNPFALKGQSSVGADLAFDSLLVASADKPFSYYGLLAETIEFDHKNIIINLADASFHDGSPVHASDIANSLSYLVNHGPYIWQQLAQYKLSFTALHPKKLHIKSDIYMPFAVLVSIGQAPIGKCFDQNVCAIPIGSGPYKLGKTIPNQSVIWHYNTSYWADKNPVLQGRYNFDTLEFHHYMHAYSAFNGFKQHEYDIRRELYYENWAQLLRLSDKKTDLAILEMPNLRPYAMQGWVFNLRKNTWQDPKMRKALSLLFPFVEINKNLFENKYERLQSYFTNSFGFMANTSSPLLVSDKKAMVQQLLDEAGYILSNQQRIHKKTGQILSVRIVVPNRELEKIANIYANYCKKMGIKVTIIRVDTASYLSTLNAYTFDLAYWHFNNTLSNIHQLQHVFTASSNPNSYHNVVGLNDEKLTILIDKISLSTALSRQEYFLELDKYLLSQFYTVRFWYPPNERIAYWGNLCHRREPSQLRSFYHWWHC